MERDGTDHEHRIQTGKTELTLEQLAAMQPGLARLMPEVSVRMWKCYHAARAGNQPLARFQLSEATKLLKLCGVVRPKYAADLDQFVAEDLSELRRAIDSGEWEVVEARFAHLTGVANDYHEQYGKGYLVWKIPGEPPADLDLTPRGP
jgi:hypothetical protein